MLPYFSERELKRDTRLANVYLLLSIVWLFTTMLMLAFNQWHWWTPPQWVQIIMDISNGLPPLSFLGCFFLAFKYSTSYLPIIYRIAITALVFCVGMVLRSVA